MLVYPRSVRVHLICAEPEFPLPGQWERSPDPTYYKSDKIRTWKLGTCVFVKDALEGSWTEKLVVLNKVGLNASGRMISFNTNLVYILQLYFFPIIVYPYETK